MENDYFFITKNDAFLIKLKMMLETNYKISCELDMLDVVVKYRDCKSERERRRKGNFNLTVLDCLLITRMF